MIRQAIGPNDHPSAPTFLQVYRMLSTYLILKPPKTGNCKILHSTCPKISISDIKDIFQSEESERIIKIKDLKTKLDTLVEEGNYEAEDIFRDHDYSLVPAKDCVTYYICGYFCRVFKKRTACDTCLLAFSEGT